MGEFRPVKIKKDNSSKVVSSEILNSVFQIAEGTDIYIPVMLSVRYGLERAEILGLR